MGINIDILKDDSKFGKFDQVIDLLFCISSVIFSFAIPFQFMFTPWIAHWFFAVLIFKIYYVLRGKEKIISFEVKNSIAILSLGLFALWSLASTKWSLQPEHTHRMVIAWLSSLLIVPGIFIFSSNRTPIILMLKSYTLGCTALISYLLIDLTQTAINGDLFFFTYPRFAIMLHISSVSYHHIYLGFIIAISIFISLRFFFEKGTKGYEKLYYVVHTILALSLLTIDNSRIIFIVLFITILLFTINKMNKNWKVIVPILLLFVLVIIAFCVLPTRTSETITNIVSKGEANDPRFEIWKALLPGIKDVPFLGYGYQAIDTVYIDLYTKANCWFAKQYHYISHSQFIESYFNLGIVGLVLSILILFGFWRITKLEKTIMSVGTFILLTISMAFDVPFFHGFVTPLLLSWLAFCYSGKKNIDISIPSKFYMLVFLVVVGLFIFITVNTYKAISKYSTRHEIEMADYSHREHTKRALKKFKIKDDNIYMIFSDVRNEMISESQDNLFDTREVAQIYSSDTIICSFEYFITDNYNASEVEIWTGILRKPHKIDLTKRGEWVSDYMIIPPSINYTSTNANGHESIVYNNSIRPVTFNATNSRRSTVKGYAMIRNLKIEKKQRQN